jgi:TrpR-related protein YerC/YecD
MVSLYEAFKNIRNEKEFINFLKDICTPSEIDALTERWEIAKLLFTTSISQKDIAEKTGASVATVTRVARFLNKEPFKGYKTILSRIYHHA